MSHSPEKQAAAMGTCIEIFQLQLQISPAIMGLAELFDLQDLWFGRRGYRQPWQERLLVFVLLCAMVVWLSRCALRTRPVSPVCCFESCCFPAHWIPVQLFRTSGATWSSGAALPPLLPLPLLTSTVSCLCRLVFAIRAHLAILNIYHPLELDSSEDEEEPRQLRMIRLDRDPRLDRTD